MIYIIKTSILSFIAIFDYLIVYQSFAISVKNTFIHIATLIDWICDVFMSTFAPRFNFNNKKFNLWYKMEKEETQCQANSAGC